MRVLVVAAPLPGHLTPLLPFAHALWDSGHEVLLASGGDAFAHGAAGPGGRALPFIDVARNLRLGRLAARSLVTHPVTTHAELTGRGGDAGLRSMFGPVNEELTDALMTVAEQWRPDVVLHEPFAVAGALTAARHDVPAVLHENGLLDGLAAAATLLDSRPLQRARARYAVRGVPPPAVVLTIAPASLVGARDALAVRPAPVTVGGPLPGWLKVPSVRPRILVLRGGGPVRGDLQTSALRVVRAAAGGLDCELVLARPPARLARRLGSGVRSVGRVAPAELLPVCAAVVHGGSSGHVLSALATGIPQLALPGPGDRRHNARLVDARGAGIGGPVTEDALRRLVHDGELAAAAREVRAEIAEMPPPQARVDVVAALA
ncbi:glycosyltransferase [Pseudonocardia sp. C8]|uniref:nucleotide disphospho-sugar-binding domain-containing protein n=1 Tax=Pseudonocardia sp. C8 TaxID=2762759 RepID=UPI00164297A6|nr:nucleotide disphospho-sugar-binding domain-containing protein [Pseudonocardia sp. C8]MBC3194405.1 glycosyltransferase [Pseudonocardia sp. C8]